MSISFHFNRPSDCWCDRHHLGANMLSSLLPCEPLSCKQTPPSTHISLSQQQTEEKDMLVRAWALTGCLCLASGRMRGERFRNLRPWRHGAAAAGLSLQAPFVDLRPLELPVVGGETWNTLHQVSPPGSRQLLTEPPRLWESYIAEVGWVIGFSDSLDDCERAGFWVGGSSCCCKLLQTAGSCCRRRLTVNWR